jgi:hypothetical protein
LLVTGGKSIDRIVRTTCDIGWPTLSNEWRIFYVMLQVLIELFVICMFNYSISEYNVLQPPPLNEKVLKDKRKKLKETLERVMTMYVSMTEF